jgi:enoyl-CoA hydratase
MSEDVLFEAEGPVAVITLNRPARLNAISSGIRQGLAEAWQRFEQDDSLKVAVLTGSGEKAFCAA